MDPFSPERLKSIFQVQDEVSRLLVSKEDGNLEFKEAFNWLNKDSYCKTMAAFANASGGYIIFGVTDSPRKIAGLTNKKFEDFDPAKIAEFLNSCISPELHWKTLLYETSRVNVGLLYTFEATTKPVICVKNCAEFKEADILYRYPGRSERIKFPELKAIIEEERRKETELWMKHLQQIASVGVHHVGIFDTASGKVSGASGSFLIDESLLPQLNFIKEGEFSETKGVPTLKLIGDVNTVAAPIQPVRQIIKIKNIRTPDIITAFLTLEKPDDPQEYFRAVCFEPSGYLPIYYFLSLAKMTLDDAVKLVKEQKGKNNSTETLLKRLSKMEDFAFTKPLNTGTTASEEKRKFLKAIQSKSLQTQFTTKELKYCLEAVRYLTKMDLNRTYLSRFLLHTFQNHYADSTIAHLLRRAICHLDTLDFQMEVRQLLAQSSIGKTPTVKTATILKSVDEPSVTEKYLSGSDISIGQKVSHPKFGIGIVKQLIGDKGKELANIDFGLSGRRLLDPRYAKLSST